MNIDYEKVGEYLKKKGYFEDIEEIEETSDEETSDEEIDEEY